MPSSWKFCEAGFFLGFELWKIVKYKRNDMQSEMRRKKPRKIKQDPKMLNFGSPKPGGGLFSPGSATAVVKVASKTVKSLSWCKIMWSFGQNIYRSGCLDHLARVTTIFCDLLSLPQIFANIRKEYKGITVSMYASKPVPGSTKVEAW